MVSKKKHLNAMPKELRDTITKDLRQALEGKSLAFETLLAMLLRAYDDGFKRGVDIAFDEAEKVGERQSGEAFDIAFDAGPRLKGKQSNNKKLSKPGGFYEKADAVRREWATGRYESKTKCAAAIEKDRGIPFDTARGYLLNAPDPNPWPAKVAKKKAK